MDKVDLQLKFKKKILKPTKYPKKNLRKEEGYEKVLRVF
jgi:hypothetical protein